MTGVTGQIIHSILVRLSFASPYRSVRTDFRTFIRQCVALFAYAIHTISTSSGVSLALTADHRSFSSEKEHLQNRRRRIFLRFVRIYWSFPLSLPSSRIVKCSAVKGERCRRRSSVSDNAQRNGYLIYVSAHFLPPNKLSERKQLLESRSISVDLCNFNSIVYIHRPAMLIA